MQRIERYGVIALVFLLVTILAVAVWGQRKNQSLLSFFKRDKSGEVAKLDTATPGTPTSGTLGLSSPTHELTPGVVADPLGGTAPVGPTDSNLVIAPPLGPGVKAVTFEQNSALIQPSGTTSPLVADAPPVVGGFLTPPLIVTPVDNGARTYKVKQGDTLGSIAGRELGSTKRWKEIEALNGVKPERLKVGMELKLPLGAASAENLAPQVLVKVDAPVADAPKVTKGTSYSVRSGDSLSRIAATQLGDANRYAEILALNPGLDPQRLSVGQSLRLPAGAKTVAAAPKAKARPTTQSSEVAKAETPKKARVQ